MKYIFFILTVLTIFSCKKDNIDNSAKSLLIKYNWYLYERRDTFFSMNLDTVYRVKTYLSDSCTKASYYTFTSNGQATVYSPCHTTYTSLLGTWSLALDNTFIVNIFEPSDPTGQNFNFGFPSLLIPMTLKSINKTELITNTGTPYYYARYGIVVESGMHSVTMIYKHQ